MPIKNLVIHENQLAEKTEVVSHQFIELPQLEAEVATDQAAFDAVLEELVAAPADPEVLVEIATRRDSARSVLEDSKSNVIRGSELVEQLALQGSSEGDAEDGASQPSEDGVAVPVTQL